MAAPENSGHSSSPLTPNPERLTRVRRDLAKILLVALGSALVAIVLVHALSHPHETAAERRAREQLDAEARQPRASPDALRKRLEDQRNLAMARAGRETASAPLGGTPLDGIPKGVPGDDAAPLPPRDHASGQSSANRDADRLALQRQIEAMQSQSLVAYEDTTRDTRGASGQTSNVQDPNRIAGSLPNHPETATDWPGSRECPTA